ncbi:hypothetical protein [Pseudonocardia sp. T1-2H]|uniref:hypothetical protein n=1 Tax=Pseudonocardia sp. T1-2H TaxID=3128899 RepID=UPI003100BFE4
MSRTIEDPIAVMEALAALEFSEPEDPHAVSVEYTHPSFRARVVRRRAPWGTQLDVLVTEEPDRKGWKAELLGDAPLEAMEALVRLALA